MMAEGLVLTIAVGCLVNSLWLDSTEGHLFAYLIGIFYGKFPLNPFSRNTALNPVSGNTALNSVSRGNLPDAPVERGQGGVDSPLEKKHIKKPFLPLLLLLCWR